MNNNDKPPTRYSQEQIDKMINDILNGKNVNMNTIVKMLRQELSDMTLLKVIGSNLNRVGCEVSKMVESTKFVFETTKTPNKKHA